MQIRDNLVMILRFLGVILQFDNNDDSGITIDSTVFPQTMSFLISPQFVSRETTISIHLEKLVNESKQFHQTK